MQPQRFKRLKAVEATTTCDSNGCAVMGVFRGSNGVVVCDSHRRRFFNYGTIEEHLDPPIPNLHNDRLRTDAEIAELRGRFLSGELSAFMNERYEELVTLMLKTLEADALLPSGRDGHRLAFAS